MDTPDPGPEAEAAARQRRSESLLRIEGFPVDAALGPFAAAAEVRPREPSEIAERAMVLCLVAVRAEGLERGRTLEWIAHFGLDAALTPEERAFLRSETAPDPEARVRFLKRYEAYWMLLWALGFLARPGRPDERCDTFRAARILRRRGREAFLAEARLRPLDELLDEADLHWRYDRAVREALDEERMPPGELEPAVVAERLHALVWLLGLGPDWDADDPPGPAPAQSG